MKTKNCGALELYPAVNGVRIKNIRDNKFYVFNKMKDLKKFIKNHFEAEK